MFYQGYSLCVGLIDKMRYAPASAVAAPIVAAYCVSDYKKQRTAEIFKHYCSNLVANTFILFNRFSSINRSIN